MTPLSLEDLHRHREYHMTQINAWNIPACIGAVAAAGSMLAVEHLPRLGWATGLHVGSVLLLSALTLGYATVQNWNHHASRVRFIDAQMNQIHYSTQPQAVALSLSPQSRHYAAVGVGLACLVLVAIGLVTYQLAKAPVTP